MKTSSFVFVRIHYESGSNVFDGLGAGNASAQTKGISRLEAKVPLRCSPCGFYAFSTLLHMFISHFRWPKCVTMVGSAIVSDYMGNSCDSRFVIFCDRLRSYGNQALRQTNCPLEEEPICLLMLQNSHRTGKIAQFKLIVVQLLKG